MNVNNKVNAAMERLILFHPFFAYIGLQLNIVPDKNLDCKMLTDGQFIKYNPEFVEYADIEEVMGKLAEQISHVILLHPLRIEGKESGLYNDAADYAVSHILKDAGIRIGDMLYNYQYSGKSAEEIYEILLTKDDENNKNQQNQQQDSSSVTKNAAGSGESDSSEPTGDNATESDESSETDNNGTELSTGLDEDNSNSGSSLQEQRQSEKEGRVVPTQSDASKGELEQQTIQMVVEAAIQAEMSGDLPGSIQAYIGELKDPKQDWRELLQKFVAEAAYNDYNWEIPDLQYMQRDLFVPSLNSQSIGGIVFAIDTSCSVREDLLREFLSEVREATSLFSEDAWVIQCDTRVQFAEQVAEDELEDIKLLGRGGTKFSPVFDFIEENDIAPKALVYLTDGYCHEILTEPDYPVMWAIYSNPRFKEQFGETIMVD